MKTILTDQVKQMYDSRQDTVLINVLGQDQFQKQHIPGSKNIPVSEDDFESKVEQTVGDKDHTVVVYCASTECDASPKAAEKLDQAGFSNVYDYEGGMKAWKDAGLPVASA